MYLFGRFNSHVRNPLYGFRPQLTDGALAGPVWPIAHGPELALVAVVLALRAAVGLARGDRAGASGLESVYESSH